MHMTDVERDLLGALGYLLVQVNYLDDALVDLYWIVAGKTEVELIHAIRRETLGGLRRIVIEAYEDRITDVTLRAQFDALKPLLTAALAVRNEFIHASYVFAKTALEHTRRPTTGPPVERIRTLQSEDLEAAINVVGAAQEAVLAMYDVTVEHLPAREIHPRGGSVSADGTYTPGATWAIRG
jgi:hypothetical protein